MYETDTTEITLDVTKLCGTKRGQVFKLWLDENGHHHDMGVKPQALNLTKLFVKSGDNLTTLWETVVVSNENVQEPTKMLGESNSL